MSRLRPLRKEAQLSEPELLVGARLLASTGPLPKSEARKRRVWAALGAGRPSRVGFRLSALRVAFASVLCAAVSSAAAGRYYIERRSEAAPPPAVTAAVPSPKPRATATAGAEPPPPARPELTRPPPPVAPARPRPEGAPRRPASAEAELLVEAMRARSAGDSQRVSELVAAYRAKHPRGVLQEEALVLSLESAVARRAPNAPALAREYLARFPNGRFAAQAGRALAAAPR